MASIPIILQPTGNPILDNPALKAQLTAQMQQSAQPQGAQMPPALAGTQPPMIHPQAQESAPPPAATMPGNDRLSLPSSAAPSVTAPRGTSAGDEAELSRKLKTGSGISQIAGKIENSGLGQAHPVLGKILGIGAQGLAQLGDIGLRTIAPSVDIATLGTSLHHLADIRGDQRQVGEDVANEEKQAQTHESGARAAEEESLPALHQAQLTLAQNKQEELQQHHQQQIDEQLRAHGYKMDENGQMQPLEYAEMSPQQQAVTDLKGAQEEYQKASGDLKKAQQANIPAQIQMAQQRLQTAQENAATAAGRLGLGRESLGFHEQQATEKVDQLPAAVQSRAYQGGAIIEAGNALKSEIDKHGDKIGNLGSYWKQYTNGTPIADPEVSGLMARIASYAALQPALHGFRGQQALAQFEKIIGGVPKNPEALKSAIDAIDDTAGIVQRTGSKHGTQPAGQPKENDTKKNSAGDNVVFKGGKWQIQ